MRAVRTRPTSSIHRTTLKRYEVLILTFLPPLDVLSDRPHEKMTFPGRARVCYSGLRSPRFVAPPALTMLSSSQISFLEVCSSSPHVPFKIVTEGSMASIHRSCWLSCNLPCGDRSCAQRPQAQSMPGPVVNNEAIPNRHRKEAGV